MGKNYSKEEREEALKLAEEIGVTAASRQLHEAPPTLTWRDSGAVGCLRDGSNKVIAVFTHFSTEPILTNPFYE